MNTSKEHILNVAFSLFLQKSFRDVTMKEIVKRTGLSTGAFYHYFSSKEELFHEILSRLNLNLITVDYERISKDSLYQFYNDYINLRNSNLLSVLQKNTDYIDGSPELNFFSLMFDALKLFPELRSTFKERQRKELQNWTTVIANAKKAGEIKTSISDEQIALLFYHTILSSCMLIVLEGRLPELRNELTLQLDGLYNSLKK